MMDIGWILVDRMIMKGRMKISKSKDIFKVVF
jgi:hypothetical protein